MNGPCLISFLPPRLKVLPGFSDETLFQIHIIFHQYNLEHVIAELRGIFSLPLNIFLAIPRCIGQLPAWRSRALEILKETLLRMI